MLIPNAGKPGWILTLFTVRAQKLENPAFQPTDHRSLRPKPGLARFLRDLDGPMREGLPMHIDIIMLQPLVALLFGILILILPRLLNYLIAIYLILVGLTGLFPHLFTSTAI
jgi:hypothetical protein